MDRVRPQGIIPPHILERIARSDDPQLRGIGGRALASLARTEFLRGHRAAIGAIAALAAVPAGELRRSVHDAGGTEVLPGKLVRSEGQPPVQDVAANEAYDGAGATDALYREVFGRASIDDRGMRLVSTVHFGKQYDNAFWDGRQMVYGDGDGVLFNRFTAALDVIGHELTHGVTQCEARLRYDGQSGALNESFSDVFGSLVKQRALKQSAGDADWLIGEGLFTPRVKGRAIRSMREPGTAYDDPTLGKDPQPGHMDGFVETADDNGGVHINSGIPNRAFCLAATAIGGAAWERAGRVWYVVLRDRLRPDAQFRDAAQATTEVAASLYGADSREVRAVRDAWATVGMP